MQLSLIKNANEKKDMLLNTFFDWKDGLICTVNGEYNWAGE